MEWPTFTPSPEQAHDLAMIARVVAQDLTQMLGRLPDSLREEVSGHAFALLCSYLSLHGVHVGEFATPGEAEALVQERAARLFEECLACRTWNADVAEQVNVRRVLGEPGGA
jgi:hypothetical protein